VRCGTACRSEDNPVILVDAVVVKVRDGQVANRPNYVATGVNIDGQRDVLRMWVGSTAVKAPSLDDRAHRATNRGIADTFIVCSDGLKGLPESMRATWPLADVQLCVVHLVRSAIRYTSKRTGGRCGEVVANPRRRSARRRYFQTASASSGVRCGVVARRFGGRCRR
jgi:putative transposase